jgi:hypothetical protein
MPEKNPKTKPAKNCIGLGTAQFAIGTSQLFNYPTNFP